MGGYLRVHIASGRRECGAGSAGVQSGGRKWDIEPVLDRLVLFRSDLVDHEVSLFLWNMTGIVVRRCDGWRGWLFSPFCVCSHAF